MPSIVNAAVPGRAGRLVRQPSGYRAFIPRPLPPDPPLALPMERSRLLDRATLALGRLDGVAPTVRETDGFGGMYVRREAVLSSQIEGTQASLTDLLLFQVDDATGTPDDVDEVVKYVAAMNHGLSRLADFPLSLHLIREIHRVLLDGVRGQHRDPGEFRQSQNWIGPQGSTLA